MVFASSREPASRIIRVPAILFSDFGVSMELGDSKGPPISFASVSTYYWNIISAMLLTYYPALYKFSDNL